MNVSNLATLVRPSAQLWGDGLVDQSVATRWRQRHWDDVDVDELTYFIPGLLAPEALNAATESSSGPASFLNEALETQLARAVAALVGLWPNGSERERQVRALGFVTALGITSIPARDICNQCRVSNPASGIRMIWAGGRKAAAIYELSVLATIDCMLGDATKLAARAVAPVMPAPSASDALIASMHSGVNGAYIYKDLAYAHETLATAAWIGKLLAGRPALLPDFIAAILIETAYRVKRNSVTDPLDALIYRHAVAAVGERRLLRLSRRVMQTGRPVAVHKKRLFALAPPRYVWNPGLEQRISAAMQRSPSSHTTFTAAGR